MYLCVGCWCYDQQVNDVLNKATREAGKTVKSNLRPDNNINAMVSAGSKVSTTIFNIWQMQTP